MLVIIHRDTFYAGIPLSADASPQEVPDGAAQQLILSGKASEAPAPVDTPTDPPEPKRRGRPKKQ